MNMISHKLMAFVHCHGKKTYDPFFFVEWTVTGHLYLDIKDVQLLHQVHDYFIYQQGRAPPLFHNTIRAYLIPSKTQQVNRRSWRWRQLFIKTDTETTQFMSIWFSLMRSQEGSCYVLQISLNSSPNGTLTPVPMGHWPFHPPQEDVVLTAGPPGRSPAKVHQRGGYWGAVTKLNGWTQAKHWL